jgi:hypothetical protein
MDMSASVEDLVKEVPNPPEDLMTSARRDLDTFRHWVEWILIGVDRLNDRFFIDSSALPFVRELVLQNAFLACIQSWRGRTDIGKASLVRAWLDTSILFGVHDDQLRKLRDTLVHQIPKATIDLKWDDSELLAIFNVAVAEHLLSEGLEWQGRQVLRDLIVRLGLTLPEVATMFRVPIETLESWESGRAKIPDEKIPELQTAGGALSTLLSIFRPERLPQVIRRRAQLFNDESAADWIVDGRIAEVAERYESAFAYQA